MPKNSYSLTDSLGQKELKLSVINCLAPKGGARTDSFYLSVYTVLDSFRQFTVLPYFVG